MIPTNFDDVVFRECLIAALCRLKLPGVQLAMLTMIAQGRHSELNTVGNNRQSRDQAMKQLWAKRLLEMRDGLPQISQAILKDVADYVGSIRSEIFASRLPGPSLIRPPAFDWIAVSDAHRQYLLAALTEAAILECEARFHVSRNEVRDLLGKVQVPDVRTRIFGMARLLTRVRYLNSNDRKLGLVICIRGAMDLNMGGVAKVKDPRTVLADWIANSPRAEEFPWLPSPAGNDSPEPAKVSGTGMAHEKRNPELVGESADAITAVSQDTVDKLDTLVSNEQLGYDASNWSTSVDQPAPDPLEQSTSSAGACSAPHAPEPTTALDPSEAAKLISSTPIDEAAPKASPSSITTANGAARDDAASTGVDASTQPPLPL
jgi:hypothetical protein